MRKQRPGFPSPLPIRDISVIRGLMQVVHFHQRNSGGVIYSAHDGGVVTWWKVCDDRRFVRVRRSVAAILNILHLILSDDAAEDRMLPVVITANHSASPVVQFER